MIQVHNFPNPFLLALPRDWPTLLAVGLNHLVTVGTIRLRGFFEAKNDFLNLVFRITCDCPFRSVGKMSGKQEAVSRGSLVHDSEWGTASADDAPAGVK